MAFALAQGAIAGCAGLLARALLTHEDAHQLAAVDPPWIEGTLLAAVSALVKDPVRVCLLGFAAACVKTAAGAATTYAQRTAAFRIGDAERERAVTSLLARGAGGASAALTHAAIALKIRAIELGVSDGVLAVVRGAAQIVPLAAALALVSTPLAGLAVLALAPFGVVLSTTRRRVRARHADSRRHAEELSSGVDELVRHADLWRTYGAGARVRREIARLARAAGRAAARAEAWRAAVSGANEALGALALVAVVAFAGSSVAVDGGSVVAFCAAFFLLYRPLRELADGTTHAQHAADASRELDRCFEAAEGGRQLPDGSRQAGSSRTWPLAPLVIDSLRVRRGANHSGVLATPATTLWAEPGEIVAVVGPTGAGKTSLLRALLGLEHDFDGSVHYGDYDLGRAGVGPSERPFAWVPQEPAVVSGTLEDNVALGARDAAGAAAALEAVGAGELARSRRGQALQAGGPDLSGGERQWVAIARALASGLPVLLLDEPTAGLDAQSQQRVLAALRAIRGQRTVLLVTHRPEPLEIADRVVEIGTSPPQPPSPARTRESGASEMDGFRAPSPASSQERGLGVRS